MTLDQLLTFLDIASTGNFRRSASRLNSAQPTVSARIKMLEEQLGQTLFHRAKNGVHLTEAGHRFHRYALIAVRALERGRAQVRLPGDVGGTLSIGLQPYLAASFGSDLVARLTEELPRTALRLEVDYSEQVVQQVSSGLLDLGIVFVPRIASDLEVSRIGAQDVVLVTSKDVEPGTSRFAETYIQVYWGEDFLETQAEALGSKASPRLSVAAPGVALDLLRCHGGAAYLDRKMIEALDGGASLRVRDDWPAYARPVYAVWRPQRMNDMLARVSALVASLL